MQHEPRIDWNASALEATWAKEVVDAVVRLLLDKLQNGNGKVRLLVSGGSTPAPIYRQLAQTDLDWRRVVIGLVDDRDVSAHSDGSNARTIREQLLQGHAVAAEFQPLRETAATLQAAVDFVNQRWRDGADQPIAAALRGMGDDGHTASLFPGAGNLDAALSTNQAYAHIDATGCEVAGDFTQRLSLTPSGLAQSSERILLIRGARKRETLISALSAGPVTAMPIRLAWQPPLAPLHVYWCAEE